MQRRTMQAALLLVILGGGILSRSVWSLEVTVNEIKGKDNVSCIDEGNPTPCKTLRFLAQQLETSGIDSNISITVETNIKKAPGSSVILFSNITSLRLKGVRRRYSRRKCKRSSQGGFVFSNITDLHFIDWFVSVCGVREADHTVAVVVKNCRDIVIENSMFFSCRQTALQLMDTYGDVSITNVIFDRNLNFETAHQIYSHSGGMEIVFFGTRSDNLASNYTLKDCNFTYNSAPSSYTSFNTTLGQTSEWRGQSIGGGLGVYFQGSSSEITISIIHCMFVDNFAKWGAGMHILFQDQATDNTVEVRDSKYIDNRADQAGGGACIRFFTLLEGLESYNQVTFYDVEFSRNEGNFGAGTSVLSTYSSYLSTSRLSFQDCTWSGNLGDYASAVDIAPALFQRLENGHLPIPEFTNCIFDRNYLKSVGEYYRSKYSGIFVITKSVVLVSGQTSFSNNLDSALYVNSGKVKFGSGSNVTFANNSAARGGAISAYGYTSLEFNRDSLIHFTKNHASELGAAIYYQSFDQHDFITGRECFLKIGEEGNGRNNTNVRLLFEDNNATVAGSSVYASTFYPCIYSTDYRKISRGLTTSVLNFLGDVQLDYDNNPLASDGREFNTSSIEPLYSFIPGKWVSIGSVHPYDEFSQSSRNRLSLLVTFKNGNIAADRNYIIEGNLRFFGEPGTNDTLEVTQVAPRKLILSLNVNMLHCPPGFYFDSEENACKCSALNEGFQYYGVPICDPVEYRAYLLRGYWIGYIPNTTQLPERLYTAPCPLNFCRQNLVDKQLSKLPNVSSELNEHVCGMERRGILCGDCTEGHSHFFHSEGFNCGSDKLCSAGIVFFVLSELVPVVILFSVVIALDISFTSGSINGFVFFCQASIDTYSTHSSHLSIVGRLFYDIFNLNYFRTSKLSFCLWRDATVIDLLAFKYVTVIFAFALVLCLILLMNRLKCSRIEEFLKTKEKLSVIKGLSAFLIICYAQCVKTSFFILTPIRLRTQGRYLDQEVVTFFGGLPFFHGRHRFYGAVAIFFIVTIVSIPPLLLTLYPLLVQLLAICKLSEHWVVGKVLKILQIYRLKPLIDAFQGSFKDKFRFFAGLYFIYRVLILASYSIARSTSQFYVISLFLLLIYMGAHSIVQPYKKQSHNVIDSLIFLNLVLINACTIFLNVYDTESRENYFSGITHIVTLFLTIRAFLFYLPMVFFLLWMAVKLIRFLSRCSTLKHLFKHKSLNDDLNSSNTIEDGILNTIDYHKMVASTSTKVMEFSISPIQKPDEQPPKIKINKAAH